VDRDQMFLGRDKWNAAAKPLDRGSGASDE